MIAGHLLGPGAERSASRPRRISLAPAVIHRLPAKPNQRISA
jgi:hypothetical protein